MRRALAASWLSGTATGVLLGLFGVQLVTSGITVGRVTPLSRPEVLAALRPARCRRRPEAPRRRHIAPSRPPHRYRVGIAPPDPVSQPADSPRRARPLARGPTAVSSDAAAPRPPRRHAPPPAAEPPPAHGEPPRRDAGAEEDRPGPTTPRDHGRRRPPTTKPAPAADDVPPTTDDGARQTGRTERGPIASKGGTVAVRYENGRVRLLLGPPQRRLQRAVAERRPDYVAVRFRNDAPPLPDRRLLQGRSATQDVNERTYRDGDDRDDDRIEPRNVSWDSSWKRWVEEQWLDTATGATGRHAARRYAPAVDGPTNRRPGR